MIECIVEMLKENDPAPKVVRELVRCKDCKNHGTMDCPMCEEGNCIFHTADNWYCADGERRTDDA